jgi:hypothetical protein
MAVLAPSDVERAQARNRRGLVWFWLLVIAGGGIGAAVGWVQGSPVAGVGFGLVAGAVLGLVARIGLWAWPLLRPAWEWRTETFTAVAALGSAVALAHVGGSWWWALLPLGPAGVLVAVPWTRRRLVAFVWCQVTRHRLHACFAAFVRATNRADPGMVPWVLSVRSTPAGQRVCVWLRTGLDVGDLEARTDKIAVALWAWAVQVLPSRRWAALVRLDITRRDPLSGVVGSPLVNAIPEQRHTVPSVRVSMVGLDLVDVPEVAGNGGR